MDFLKKIKNIPQGVKASVGFFLASVVTKGIAYITTPVYTRLLTTEEYGQVSVFLTWVQVFGIIAMFCLSYGVFNIGMSDYPDKRDDYSFSMLMLSNIITVIFSALLLILYPSIQSLLKLDLPLVILMLVLFFFQPAYNFWLTKQRYELQYKWSVFWSILISLASPLIAVICISLNKSGSNLYPRLFGAEGAQIAIYIGFYIYLGKKNKFQINTRYWKEALLFNLPLIPHYLSTYLLGSSDRIMISHLIGDTATAYYTVAYSVAAVATIVWTAVNSSLVPYTYEKCKTKDYKSINNIVMPLLVLFAGACVFVILLAPEAVKIMATHDYLEAIYVIPPIVGGVFFQVLYYVFANIVYYYKKPTYVMVGSGIAVVLNIVLNYIFIQMYGYVAAGYTTLFCYGVQAIFDCFAMRKVEKERVYNIKFIVGLSGAVVFIALFSNLLYDMAIARYAILAVLILLVAVNYKRVLKIWASMK